MAPSSGLSVPPRDQVSASKQIISSRLPINSSSNTRCDRPSSSPRAHLQLNLTDRSHATYEPTQNAALCRARAGQVNTRDNARFGNSRAAKTGPNGVVAKPQSKDDVPDADVETGIIAITPTPSLVSGSSMSTQDSPRTNVLRRKPSVIGNYTSRNKSKENGSRSGDESLEYAAVPFRPDIPTASTNYEHTNYYLTTSDLTMFPKLYMSVQDPSSIPPPTPLSDPSSFTPSLRHTESPGAFSQVTTPTTRTSYSPLVAASPQIGVKAWASPSKSSLGYDSSRPSSSRRQQLSPDEPFGHPFFRDSSLRSTSPRKQTPEGQPTSGQLYSSFRQRSKLTKPRPAEKSGPFSNTKAQKSSEKVHPPELAHLSEAIPPPPRVDSQPPSRPSREGTPNLAAAPHFPVVYSNLSSVPSTSQRRPSSSGHRDQLVGTTSHNQKQTGEPLNTSNTSKSALPKSASKTSISSSGASTATPAPPPGKTSPTKSSSRFGFFSRRVKADESPDDTTAKQPRKGPIAGTGHEGYGKHAVKARTTRVGSPSGSTAAFTKAVNPNQTPIDRKRSSSQKDDSDMDEFFSQRLNPVYLRGDGVTLNEPKDSIDDARSDSRQSIIEDEFQISPSLDSPKTSQTSRSSMDPSSFPRSQECQARGVGFENKESKYLGSNSQPRNLTPLPSSSAIVKGPTQGWSSETSLDSIKPASVQVSKLPTASKHRSISSSEGNSERSEPIKSAELPKRKKGSWLSFVKSSHRVQPATVPRSIQEAKLSPEEPSEESDMPVQITPQGPPTAVAHYAMIDSEDQNPGLEDIEKYMEEAKFESDENHFSDHGLRANDFYHARTTQTTPSESETENNKSGERTSPPVDESSVKSKYAATETPLSPADTRRFDDKDRIQAGTEATTRGRPSRLPQVGRIPKVISSRTTEVVYPERSSSKTPADSSSPHPQPLRMADLQAQDNGNVADYGSNEDAIVMESTSRLGLHTVDPAAQIIPPPKLFAFTSRKGSITSCSSSSAASFFPTAAATAVVPGPCSPLSEDEIWKEYDDLLDDVVSPISPSSPSVIKGKGASSQNSLASDQKSAKAPHRDVFARDFGTASVEKSTTTQTDDRPAPLKPGWSLLDEDAKTCRNSRRATYTGSDRTSTSTGRSSLSSNRKSVQIKHKRSTSLNQILDLSKTGSPDSEHVRTPIQRVVDPQYMANLRFGALMTSKWLSFGRVLFSPIHTELKGPDQERLLVLDGLGKDWSYYCALTYPDVSVYSLGPAPSTSSHRQSLGSWQSLPNHRHFSHSDWTSNFPFPKGFFAAVIFRFPGAMSEVCLRSTLSECKRVLRPGGYIEVSALDLDLTNMGNTARKAIRELKIKMQRATPNVSLKPMSDQVQYLLGRRGFENLKSCIVGVPAAGMISDSREASLDESSKTLTELVNDSSQEGDESITKMVSRVGRWWYTRCYEMSVLPNGDLTQSVWNDKILLRECERLSTTFKLLVCHAQKPYVTQRRTVSL